MTAEIRFFWARLHANYWFFPATFAILAAVLASGMIALDRSGFAETLNNASWLVAARPKGAADMLTVMAGSMIGVASTVFSITLVAVTYASGNYGPRLLTNFMEDRGNQLSLATFIGSFVYALIVLRSVRAEDETPAGGSGAADALPGFVPQLSLLVAYLLMAVCVAVLVFFLHHIPSSIRINTVLEKIGTKLIAAIRKTYPVEDEFSDSLEQVAGKPVLAKSNGYVQMIDFEDLEKTARKHNCTLSLKVRTGDFVHRDLPLLEISDGDPEELADTLREDFTLGASRTPEQDPQFLIDELVEIGLRALSPGINDPFTAITALHWLGAATSEIGRRDLRKDICGADADDCPVIPLPDDFDHYLKRGFGSIRSAVASSPTAAEVMLDTISNAATPIKDENRQAMLRDEGKLLAEQVRGHLTGPDLDRFEKHAAEFDRCFWAETDAN
ncbi:DUF2254 domain-containing protein [Pontixanthobacter aestiaquae]|uniref:DUF2254 domain-containing protein n=1 Tax=Pontixanthobacter aestiaquae TaxID=1509367 RepID=A0A844Z4H5_9SPHN|nr:DUF2254 domain-containing protein [Pontixanthobacter aestiaquae]MDN3646193.1 DUF2254 domain-containing protein [Pontixanthobacter aestiaquae]MXO82815.1 DUF2254 domain-containing protein [Pontixanthobacter aestiaquae]